MGQVGTARDRTKRRKPVLQTVGTVVGSFFGPVGAAIGSALGGLAGASLDRALLGTSSRRAGPRLDTLQMMASTEGAPIPRLYGAARLSGQVIWSTALDEIVSTSKVGPKGARQTVTEYAYRANFAVGLCEGRVSHVRRVWADGKPLDLRGVVMRLHGGDEDQLPDPLIVAKEGAADAPAYRGLAYVVFEGLALEGWGNRLPQLAFELVRPVGGLEGRVRAITLIPGAGEFVYEDRIVTARPRPGTSERINRHLPGEASDLVASLDELQALCPALEHVSLVVAWFGDDLRAGSCTVRPRVEVAAKTTSPVSWSAAGLSRTGALVVSTGPDGRPAYGGTPSDESVVRAIRALKARGIAVTLYPFVMMDIPAGNALPDPWTGTAPQPAYPWRGRIGVGTADGTAAAAAGVATFFGTVPRSAFSVAGSAVAYLGPAGEWSYRRMILHYASLAEAAGGVEAFVIGSELAGLTRARSAPGVYPAVAALVALASDAAATLRPGTRLVYGADWTEYGAHVSGGGQEVRFPLDPLWASPAITAVALDWYPPLSDWREGTGHLDAAVAGSIHDRAFLGANVAGGEAFDWYYASEADRDAQRRTPITDGAYGKPWTFRQKDLAGWWSNAHVERVAGLERPAPTAWVPRSKPIWLIEAGCPAIDKGSNRPSAFPDPKSSEDGLPPFSDGTSDPLIQTRAIEALIDHFEPADAVRNPVSPLYGGPMLDPARIYLWAWDARPFPAFPAATGTWADGANWALGHWLTGRLGTPALDRLVEAILRDHGIAGADASALVGIVPGAVADRPMTARSILEPIAALFGFEAIDRAGIVTFRHLGAGVPTLLDRDGLSPGEDDVAMVRVRGQESELPRRMSVAFVDPDADYAPAVETSRRLETLARDEVSVDTALALTRGEAARRIDVLLQDRWIGRETVQFGLPRSHLAIEPGDLVDLDLDGRLRTHLVTRIGYAGRRTIGARRIEPRLFSHAAPARAATVFVPPDADARPEAVLLDLPTLREGPGVLQWLAATAKPWPGPLNLWRSADGGSFSLQSSLARPATVGRLQAPLPPGPAGRWDRAGSLLVELAGTGDLAGRPEGEVLDGANALAVRRPDASWEVLQFALAAPMGDGVALLSGLLRGQLGTDGRTDTLPAGSEVVLLDDALAACVTRADEIGRPLLWRVGSAGLDVGDDAVAQLSSPAVAVALLPLAPAHLRAVRGPDAIRIAWIRRTRIGGDAWDVLDVALGEDREAYEVDIVAAGAVVRTLSTATPEILYPAAAEIADFGAVQASLVIRVHQISALAGRGTAREATIHV